MMVNSNASYAYLITVSLVLIRLKSVLANNDECFLAACRHKCNANEDEYWCSCYPGFLLMYDGRSCRRTGTFIADESTCKLQKKESSLSLLGDSVESILVPTDDDLRQLKDEDECDDIDDEGCPLWGPLHHIPDTKTGALYDPDRGMHSLPDGLVVKESSIPRAGLGVFTEREVPARTAFGPYCGVKILDQDEEHMSGYSWVIEDKHGQEMYSIDGTDTATSNWMRYINSPLSESGENLVAFQFKDNMYYRTTRRILPGEELLVWYGDEFALYLGLIEDQ